MKDESYQRIIINFLQMLIWGLVFFSVPAFGWSTTGHITIGKMAYKWLSKDARAKLDKAISTTWSNVNNDVKDNLIQTYGSEIPSFAFLSTFPDRFRNLKVHEYYKEFNESVPKYMLPYKHIRLGTLHFINRAAFPKNNDCSIGSTPNIYTTLNILKYHVFKSGSVADLALFAHLIMDIHQPLHTLGKVDSNCHYDEGGNKFCIGQLENDKCPKPLRLHYIFDTIAFENNFIDKNIKSLLLQCPSETLVAKQAYETDIKVWMDENLTYAPFIYGIKEEDGISSEYAAKAKAILTKRAVLAATRLAFSLENILNGAQGSSEL